MACGKYQYEKPAMCIHGSANECIQDLGRHGGSPLPTADFGSNVVELVSSLARCLSTNAMVDPWKTSGWNHKITRKPPGCSESITLLGGAAVMSNTLRILGRLRHILHFKQITSNISILSFNHPEWKIEYN